MGKRGRGRRENLARRAPKRTPSASRKAICRRPRRGCRKVSDNTPQPACTHRPAEADEKLKLQLRARGRVTASVRRSCRACLLAVCRHAEISTGKLLNMDKNCFTIFLCVPHPPRAAPRGCALGASGGAAFASLFLALMLAISITRTVERSHRVAGKRTTRARITTRMCTSSSHRHLGTRKESRTTTAGYTVRHSSFPFLLLLRPSAPPSGAPYPSPLPRSISLLSLGFLSSGSLLLSPVSPLPCPRRPRASCASWRLRAGDLL